MWTNEIYDFIKSLTQLCIHARGQEVKGRKKRWFLDPAEWTSDRFSALSCYSKQFILGKPANNRLKVFLKLYQKILISRTMSLNFSLFNIKSRRHKRSHSAVPIPKNLNFVLIPFKYWIQKAFYPIMLWWLDCRGKKEKKEHKTPEGQRQIHKKT